MTVALPDEFTAHQNRTTELRDQAAATQADAASEARAVVRALQERGFSVRDIGHVLGVSFQRASQLINS